MQFPLCSERHYKCRSALMPLTQDGKKEHSAQPFFTSYVQNLQDGVVHLSNWGLKLQEGVVHLSNRGLKLQDGIVHLSNGGLNLQDSICRFVDGIWGNKSTPLPRSGVISLTQKHYSVVNHPEYIT